MSAIQLAAFVLSIAMVIGIFALAIIERQFKKNHIGGLIIVIICYFPIFGYFPSSIQFGGMKVEFFKELRQELETKEKILGTYNDRIISSVGIADLRGGN